MALPDWLWRRHSNPKSGWSRVPTGGLFVLAIYRRDVRLFVATLAWTLLNPVAFRLPADNDAWMTRGILGERAWIEDGNPLVGLSYPSVCNLASVPVYLYALYAAARERPLHAAAGTALAAGLKLQFVAAVADYYDRTRGDS